MLFTLPTPALEAVRTSAAPAVLAQVSALGNFSKVLQGGALGTARRFAYTADARTASGWLSVRRPVLFMAGRGMFLGTGHSTSFETMVRAASGWLSARPSQICRFLQGGALGTARRFAHTMDARTASGWLSVRRPVVFMAGRGKSLGTELPSSFETMVRAASGRLSARPSQIFRFLHGGALGTARRLVKLTNARTASGWLSVRRSVPFMVGSGSFSGGGIVPQLRTMVRAASGVLSARPSFLSGECGFAAESADRGGESKGYHLPVFPAECAEWMDAGPGKWIIDGTLGGGGHSEIFLKTGASVLGIDRDPEALAHASARLAGFGDRFSTWEGNFSSLREIPGIQRGGQADGLLLDLGVSSRQLDSAARGFSFQREGPLDMRMGPSSPRTAAEIVNTWEESELTRILFEFGEEPKARRIAAAMVRQREKRPFATTLELAACIEAAVGRHGRTHPATRAFQAIRMAVNEELESLAAALAAVPQVLKPGGRLLVITFHSLEDRLVKRFLRHRSSPMLDEPGWPEPRPNPDFQFQLLSRKAILPGATETSLNPRARSAKLRVARIIATTP
jgi:16S rRNA (cytosine1402-N4)-methyltransferase